ncbi:MAG: hypothetical protein R2789_13510 [Microthrixaceae bacterium]
MSSRSNMAGRANPEATRPSVHGCLFSATEMFSATVSDGNNLAFWNERPRPSSARIEGGIPSISVPRKRTELRPAGG